VVAGKMKYFSDVSDAERTTAALENRSYNRSKCLKRLIMIQFPSICALNWHFKILEGDSPERVIPARETCVYYSFLSRYLNKKEEKKSEEAFGLGGQKGGGKACPASPWPPLKDLNRLPTDEQKVALTHCVPPQTMAVGPSQLPAAQQRGPQAVHPGGS